MRIFFGGIFTGGNCLVGIIWVVIFQLGVFMSPRFYAFFMNSKDLKMQIEPLMKLKLSMNETKKKQNKYINE